MKKTTVEEESVKHQPVAYSCNDGESMLQFDECLNVLENHTKNEDSLASTVSGDGDLNDTEGPTQLGESLDDTKDDDDNVENENNVIEESNPDDIKLGKQSFLVDPSPVIRSKATSFLAPQQKSMDDSFNMLPQWKKKDEACVEVIIMLNQYSEASIHQIHISGCP